MISRHQTRTLSFLFLLLLFVALSRLILLDARPFHHDESLFSYYAWVLCDSGDYSHHPLLHGPLQIQLVAASLKTSTWLGIHGNGDFWARFPAAMAGIILLLLVWLLRRPLGKEGRWIAALLAAVSPGIWYYSRFCRNEPLFLCVTVLFLWTITRAWRSTRPSGWIVASFLAGAGLIALKENSLFLLFDGICFLGLMVLYGCKHGTGRIGKPLVSSLRVHRWAWLAALLAGWLLLEAIYTNFLQWDKAFLAKYARSWATGGASTANTASMASFTTISPSCFSISPSRWLFSCGVPGVSFSDVRSRGLFCFCSLWRASGSGGLGTRFSPISESPRTSFPPCT
ncbi:TIGR03663 family protein [bacterium]|nr:TIGR03663 family protein [bacterium]